MKMNAEMNGREVRELSQEEVAMVAGGQAKRSYCVYANGTVGVHDFDAMVSRPLNANESCG